MFGIETEGVNASLFLFYLTLGTAWMWNVLPPDLITMFNENRTIQMVFAYLALVFTVDLYNPSAEKSVFGSMLYAALLFLWFILTSKLHLKTNLAIITILFVSFIVYKCNQKNREKLNKLKADKDTHFLQEEAVKSQIDKLANIQKVCFVIVLIITLVGNYFYFMEHHKKYYKQDKGMLDFIMKYLFAGSKKFYPPKVDS
jgi:hypothetical protein